MADDFASGMLQGQQYSQHEQLFKLSQQEEATTLESSKLALKQQKQALEMSQQMMAHASGTGQEAADALTGNLDMLFWGAVGQGKYEQAASIQEKRSQIAGNQALLAQRITETKKSRLETAANILQDTPDTPEGFKEGVQRYRVITGDNTADWEKLQWRPGLKQQLTDAVTTQQQKMTMKAEQARTSAAEAQQQEATARIPLIKAQTAEAQARAKTLQKSGVMLDEPADEGVVGMVSTGMPLTVAVPGYGKDAVAERKKVRDGAIAQIKLDNPNMSDLDAGKELARRNVEYAAGKSSTMQLTKMLGATRQAVDQLTYNADKATEEMRKLPSSNLSPIVNAIARGAQKWTGDPAYSGLFFYMYASATESARILAGGQASIAQLHQGAQDEAKQWASINITPASWKEVVTAMKGEGQERLKTYQDAVKMQEPGSKAADSATLKEGATGKSKSGRPIVVRDGKWVYQ